MLIATGRIPASLNLLRFFWILRNSEWHIPHQ
jgi:hypothetical protein